MLTAALIIAAIFLVACFVGAFIHHGNPIEECPEKVERFREPAEYWLCN